MALTFIDLFCGAGGWTTGLKRAGLKHIVGIDNDAHAIETYRHNHGESSAMHADVRDVTKKHIAPHLRLAKASSVDVVFASPPCQSFSLAGKRVQGSEADILFMQTLRLAKALGARMLVMENVVGMLSKLDASGKSVFDNIQNQFHKHGFKTLVWKILKSEEFEVPQMRRRVLIIATRSNSDADFFPFPVPNFDARLATVLQKRGSVPDFHWMTEEKGKYYVDRQRTKGFVRFVKSGDVAKTVRAGYLKSRGAEALIQYKDGKIRMLTELECARIQSFPDTYKFCGSRSEVYKQIGNAVPPMMAYHIGLKLRGGIPP